MFLIPANYILYIDIVLVVLLVVSILIGYKKGLATMGLSALRFVIAFFVAKIVGPILASKIKIWPKKWAIMKGTVMEGFLYTATNKIAWYILTFILTLLLLFVLSLIMKPLFKLPVLKQVNGVLGACVSTLIYLGLVILVTFVLKTPLFKNGDDVINDSLLKPINGVSTVVFDKAMEYTKKADILRKLMNGEIIDLDAYEDNLGEFVSGILNDYDELDFSELLNDKEVEQSLENQDVDKNSILEFIQKSDFSIDKVTEFIQDNKISKDVLENILNIFTKKD